MTMVAIRHADAEDPLGRVRVWVIGEDGLPLDERLVTAVSDVVVTVPPGSYVMLERMDDELVE